MSTSVRAQVAAMLATLVTDESWAIKPHTVKQVLTLSKPTVYVEHTGITALPEAPIGHLRNTVAVTILDPHTDWDKAEDDLDTAVLELITALDAHDRLAVTEATKTSIADAYLGWAITLTLITDKE
jgi:hypothetical protein